MRILGYNILAEGVLVVLKKLGVALLGAIVLAATPEMAVFAVPANPQGQEQGPAYAKWGKMAVLLTQKRYPHANVVDYQHVGRVSLPGNLVQEVFKLWLRQPDREFGVYVRIAFDPSTEKVKSIDFQETSR